MHTAYSDRMIYGVLNIQKILTQGSFDQFHSVEQKEEINHFGICNPQGRGAKMCWQISYRVWSRAGICNRRRNIINGGELGDYERLDICGL